jgi:hypothetical protein
MLRLDFIVGLRIRNCLYREYSNSNRQFPYQRADEEFES